MKFIKLFTLLLSLAFTLHHPSNNKSLDLVVPAFYMQEKLTNYKFMSLNYMNINLILSMEVNRFVLRIVKTKETNVKLIEDPNYKDEIILQTIFIDDDQLDILRTKYYDSYNMIETIKNSDHSTSNRSEQIRREEAKLNDYRVRMTERMERIKEENGWFMDKSQKKKLRTIINMDEEEDVFYCQRKQNEVVIEGFETHWKEEVYNQDSLILEINLNELEWEDFNLDYEDKIIIRYKLFDLTFKFLLVDEEIIDQYDRLVEFLDYYYNKDSNMNSAVEQES